MKKAVKKNKAIPAAVLPAEKKYDRHLFVITGIAFLIYFNTCFNQYALDDYLVISKNSYTQQGIAGIPSLITKPSYFGFFKNANEEVTLRYRPLVMISYALECQFFKDRDVLLFISHLINVLIFTVTVAVLYLLLKEMLPPAFLPAAFFATLLFAVHPVHTESVANLKGRDELLSFLFAVSSALFIFRFISLKQRKTYILSVILFTAGLFSKESTIAFLAVFPLMIYFFSKKTIREIANILIPFLTVAVMYVVIRFSVTGWSHPPSPDILNNPYIHATVSQKYATIFLSLGYYIKLLFCPHPLSYDYTFNQISLVDFNNLFVLLSLVAHIALGFTAVLLFRKKSIFSFSILFYFITIILVTNIFFNLGAFIGERLIYTPSLAFCIITGYLIQLIADKLNTRHFNSVLISGLILVPLIVAGSIKTIARNAVWKNNFTLMTHDAEVSTNSMKANDACAVTLILATDDTTMSKEEKKDLITRAIHYDHRAAEIMPSFTDIYFNLGVAFSRLELPDSAAYFWNVARNQKPGDIKLRDNDLVLANLFLKRGLQKAVDKDMNGCLADLGKAVKYAPLNTDAWYNYGGALYSEKKFSEAEYAFKKVVEIDPSNQQAQLGLKSLEQIMKKN